MITDINQLDFKKRYSYADYLTWKFSERVELIRGWIYKMSPAPQRRHQYAVSQLHGIFWNYFHKQNCQLYSAPFDVRLLKKGRPDSSEVDTVVQPDICVVCDLEKLDEAGCVGAPDLIVEVTSPGTAKKDYNEKYNLYEQNGVKEYWIASPEAQSVEIFYLEEEGYQSLGVWEARHHHSLQSKLFSSLEVKLADLFKD